MKSEAKQERDTRTEKKALREKKIKKQDGTANGKRQSKEQVEDTGVWDALTIKI